MTTLLSMNWASEEPEATEPEEGYTIPVIPPGGRTADEWDELAKQAAA